MFVTTDSLSSKTSAGTSMSMANIRSFYLRHSLISLVARSAKTSEPKLEISTMFCILLFHAIGMFMRHNVIPECDPLLKQLPTWLALSYTVILNLRPLGSGI